MKSACPNASHQGGEDSCHASVGCSLHNEMSVKKYGNVSCRKYQNSSFFSPAPFRPGDQLHARAVREPVRLLRAQRPLAAAALQRRPHRRALGQRLLQGARAALPVCGAMGASRVTSLNKSNALRRQHNTCTAHFGLNRDTVQGASKEKQSSVLQTKSTRYIPDEGDQLQSKAVGYPWDK